jgi:dihydrolipoamide dehydrogenase
MTYDVVVIGSGPGGYSAAVRAGQYGLKTALIERQSRLGGCCLLVGCIPTKALLHTADVWEYFKHPEVQGMQCKDPQLNYSQVLDRKNKIVTKHSKGIDFLMRKNKVDVIKGTARLAGNGRIEVTGDKGAQTVEAKNIILASGSEARMLPGLDPDPNLILTNVEILDMPVIPKTIGIIGAGAVGVEFASIFNRFGSKVTIIEMLPRLVPVEDEEVSKELEKHFKKTGIRCETAAKAENMRKNAIGVTLCATLANGQKEDMAFDKLLVAVGRKPNTDNIGLEKTRTQLDRGFVKVDE